VKAYRGDPMPEEAQKALYDELLMGYPAERVIFGFEDFLCPPQRVFEMRALYGNTKFRSTSLRYLFPENPCEFFISIRNPASFVPAVMRAAASRNYTTFTKGVDPRDMRWSRLIETIQDNNPDCPITVWCNEDTPLIWPTVLREISDADDDVVLDGELDVLRSIMSEDGFARMQAYLKSHEPPNEIQRRRVFAAFLDKFVLEDQLEENIDLPGWTPEFVEEITSLYDDDVYRIERMPGVNFIAT